MCFSHSYRFRSSMRFGDTSQEVAVVDVVGDDVELRFAGGVLVLQFLSDAVSFVWLSLRAG